MNAPDNHQSNTRSAYSQDDRASAFTLEAAAAAFIVLLAMSFLFAVSTTPSTADHLQSDSQTDARAASLLTTAGETGTLTTTLRYWNQTGSRFHSATQSDGAYDARNPPTEFGDQLTEAFPNATTHIEVTYWTDSVNGRQQATQTLVDGGGSPPPTATTTRYTVTLYDTQPIVAADGDATSTTLGESTEFYAPDAAPDSIVYNTVVVEVSVWNE